MKITLTVFAFLICTLCQAQNVDFLKQLDQTTVAKTQALADSIASQTTEPFKLYKASEKKDQVYFVYIPSAISKTDFNYFKQAEKALVIEFNIYTGTVSLNRIVAPFKEALNVWQHYFKETPNLDDYDNRKIKIEGVAFRIDKDRSFNQNVWQIKEAI